MSLVVKRVKEKISILEMERDKLLEEIEKKEKIIKDQSNTINNTLEGQILPLRKENKNLLQKIEEHSKVVKDKDDVINNFNIQVSELRKEIITLEEMDNDEHNKLKTENEKLQREIESMKTDLKYKSESLEDTITQLENSISEKQDIENKIEEMKKEIKEITNRLTLKDIQIEKLKGDKPIRVPIKEEVKENLIFNDDVAQKTTTQLNNPVQQPVRRSMGLYYSMGGF